ncbi:MAG: hypothetical protein D4R84_15140 [Rhodocyclaceae bacterium]|nr:MAG: hypothetical protein D4R84_15140 [Rhodocyclaceae bacterium]
MKASRIVATAALALIATGSMAQTSQTRIKGNTEINVTTQNTTAVATGENNVAKNRIGVIQGDKKGDTRISVSATNVTTVVGGRNKKTCTNIGAIVKDECK